MKTKPKPKEQVVYVVEYRDPHDGGWSVWEFYASKSSAKKCVEDLAKRRYEAVYGQREVLP